MSPRCRPGRGEVGSMSGRCTASHGPVRPGFVSVLLTLVAVAVFAAPSAAGEFKGTEWPYTPPRPPTAPSLKDRTWVRNPVDAFVLAKLEHAGLHPNPPADKLTLLRRVTFDLTGLAPTPEETKAFLSDNSPNAYEKVVDRLLASPR